MIRSTIGLQSAFPPAPRPLRHTFSFWGALLISVQALMLGGCSEKREPPPAPRVEPVQAPQNDAQPSTEATEPAPGEKQAENPEESEELAPSEPPPPHKGPWLWVLRSSAAIYKEPKDNREQKLGYAKRGGQIPIIEGKVEGEGCSKGWYKVATGGYICSLVGTTDKDHKDVKFRPTQPNLDDILPYTYARNAKNGTPLYKTIPTTKQIHKYEPYLPAAKAAQEKLEKERQADLEQMRKAGLTVGEDLNEGGPTPETETPADNSEPDSVAKGEKQAKNDPAPTANGEAEAEADAPEVPLWEREENLHEVTLEDLRKESDDILAQRMMKGFYIAIDKTFKWDGRTWYKTTKGVVTPSERFWQTAGSDFQGVELDGEDQTLPIGWVFGGQKSASTFEIDLESNKATKVGSIEKFEAIPLAYGYHRIGDIDYIQMRDGKWIRDRYIRMTTPGPRPKEVGPNERWIDVDISEQTVVVFEGDRPVYATLMSSGKESSIKEKDHRTPRGMWRVREKHIVSTMDGNGSAAGDMPYSIEDVPYIMYFHKSYATHGAFWHRNYGVQMSHGCINLAPLDAKWIFFHADPPVHEGYHGAWSSDERPGSMVVVHD